VVDVDVGSLEFAQDRVEFGECVGVAGGRLVGHGSALRLMTVLVTVPSASAVVIVSSTLRSSTERTIVPSARRVIDHPRAS
jgi:hypothetical protein